MSVGDRRRRVRTTFLLAALLASGAALASSSPAAAAVRYAGPHGSPTDPCSHSAPCDFATAVQDAANGDEVIVTRGTYALGATPIVDSAAIFIHGAAEGPRPRLVSSVAGADAVSIKNSGSKVSLLELDAPGGTALAMAGGLGEELVVSGSGLPDGVCALSAGTLRDSTCVASQTGAAAVMSVDSGAGGAALANVTAIANGAGGIGVYARAVTPGGSEQLALTNVIARGVAHDIVADAAAGTSCAVSVTHSNYGAALATPPATVSDDGTQQAAPPVFVNATGGDYHEALSSPTIDRGLTSADNGFYDVDGDARVVGAGTDIGSDELDLPPSVNSEPAVPVHPVGATLWGVVNPNGPPTNVTFQYGTSRRYGEVANAGQLGPIGYAVPVALAVLGLRPGTVYHYRVVAASPVGTRVGGDLAFSTPPLALMHLLEAQPQWREATPSTGAGMPVGTSFTFMLNDTANVVFTFTRQVSGRLHFGACRRHARRGPRCVLNLPAGSLRVRGHAGSNAIRFRGRVAGKPLPPGNYTAAVVAHANDAKTGVHRLAFTIVG